MKRDLKGLFFAFLLSICLPLPGFAEPCSKPRVAVVFDEIVNEKEFFEHVNSRNASQPDSSWVYQIEEKVLEELQMGSPETEFIIAYGGAPPDCDYCFEYRMTLISAGEDIMWAGALLGEYTAFYMSSSLHSNDVCGISGRILDVEITQDDEDLDHTIERNIAAWGDIGDRIKEYEKSHLVPPRGPDMTVSPGRDYVSPLKEERKLDLGIKVTNCQGQDVFDRFNGLKIFLPAKTERGELEPTKGFRQELINIGGVLILIVVRPVGASATYELKKGLTPAREEVKIETCGRDKRITRNEKVEIRGLEIRVKPHKNTISAGGETSVDIHFNRTTVEGGEDPIEGKRIKIEVKGLVDGKVSPTGDVVTKNDGKASLTYRAGKNDRRVTIEASYQPEDYPESVKGSGTVTVSKEVYDLIVDVSADVSWDRKDEKTLTTGNASYTISGTMKMKTDPGTMRVNPMHMTFKPQDLELQYAIQEKKIELEPKNDCPDLIYELSGGDTVRLPQIEGTAHRLNIQNFGTAAKRFSNVQIPAQMKGFLMNWFDFLMGGAKTVLKGQKREGDFCGKENCPCKEYRDFSQERDIGWTYIRAYVGENGSMSGSHSWQEDGITSGVGVKVNKMTPRTKKGPKEEGKTRYNVRWNFRRVERQGQ